MCKAGNAYKRNNKDAGSWRHYEQCCVEDQGCYNAPAGLSSCESNREYCRFSLCYIHMSILHSVWFSVKTHPQPTISYHPFRLVAGGTWLHIVTVVVILKTFHRLFVDDTLLMPTQDCTKGLGPSTGLKSQITSICWIFGLTMPRTRVKAK